MATTNETAESAGLVTMTTALRTVSCHRCYCAIKAGERYGSAHVGAKGEHPFCLRCSTEPERAGFGPSVPAIRAILGTRAQDTYTSGDERSLGAGPDRQ